MQEPFKQLKKIALPAIRHAKTAKIIRLYQKGDIQKIRHLSFSYLEDLCLTDLDVFFKIKHTIEDENLKALAQKTKIKVGFIVYTPSMWSYDALFQMLQKDSRFSPCVVICTLSGNTPETNRKTHEDALKYFRQKSYKFIDATTRKLSTPSDFDLLFYSTPYPLIQKSFNLLNVPMQTLIVHTPYSFMVAERSEKYNLPMYRLSWKFFTDTLFYKNLMKKHSRTKDDNIIFCGYPRMDELLTRETQDVSLIWKIPEGGNPKSIKKIIYAPHHSVNDPRAGFSTFEQSAVFIYELAKKYKNTSWIVKPHPLLRSRAVKNGFFKSTKEYDNYLSKWQSLPNAKVVEEGDYFDIFKTSDAMILDSVSFLAEYQYTHKPLLFLTRKTQHFNEFGQELQKVLYTAPGNDYTSIEDFLQNVIIDGGDSISNKRQEFFSKYLDYYNYNNHKTASKFIYDYLIQAFTKRDTK